MGMHMIKIKRVYAESSIDRQAIAMGHQKNKNEKYNHATVLKKWIGRILGT
jgi:uncharacterized protein YeaO (DUF488 family)